MLKPVLIGVAAVLLCAAPALACTNITSKTVKLTGCVDTDFLPPTGRSAHQEFFNYSKQDKAENGRTE
jgi:hypothetical protein